MIGFKYCSFPGWSTIWLDFGVVIFVELVVPGLLLTVHCVSLMPALSVLVKSCTLKIITSVMGPNWVKALRNTLTGRGTNRNHPGNKDISQARTTWHQLDNCLWCCTRSGHYVKTLDRYLYKGLRWPQLPSCHEWTRVRATARQPRVGSHNFGQRAKHSRGYLGQLGKLWHRIQSRLSSR